MAVQEVLSVQWFFNILYQLCSSFFELVGQITAPTWVSNLTIGIVKYAAIANWYFPLDTLVVVALSVLGITLVLMLISAFLQIF